MSPDSITLPHALRRLLRTHQKVLYDLLFQASQQALQKLASDPKYIGATLGMIGVLQTWTRDLRYHPYIQYLIPGAGFTLHPHTWRPARYNYLLPEKRLAQIFRAKVRDLLKKATLFDQVPSRLWHQDWVVDIIAVGNGEAALKYLGPYIFRVAISKRNILDLKNSQVTFRYRDSKTDTTQTTTLPVEQFIHRFLQHVLPRGFQKVRYFGFLHPKQRSLLARLKKELQLPSSLTAEALPEPHSAQHPSRRPTAPLCPYCASEMIHIRPISRKRAPP